PPDRTVSLRRALFCCLTLWLSDPYTELRVTDQPYQHPAAHIQITGQQCDVPLPRLQPLPVIVRNISDSGHPIGSLFSVRAGVGNRVPLRQLVELSKVGTVIMAGDDHSAAVRLLLQNADAQLKQRITVI